MSDTGSMTMSDEPEVRAIQAQAHMHHAYLLGLQLMVNARHGAGVMGDWMFRLFRRQHLDKFLSSFDKLGLSGLPHAVACARYHVLSNNLGGVGVEYMEESDRKAWVRFRYPRWMYAGPAICGVPVEVSRGFLEGWYAHNGVSLGNPRLGYVCVSEDMTGEFGLCGYFHEYDRELAPEERLRFARDELPPPFDPAAQPEPPAEQWTALRQHKASRNYALGYIRNGLCELAGVIGPDAARRVGRDSARLIGLQYFADTAALVDAADAGLAEAAAYLAAMFRGMGDEVVVETAADECRLQHRGLRAVRGLEGDERALVLDCWQALWAGTLSSQRELKTLRVTPVEDGLHWTIGRLAGRG